MYKCANVCVRVCETVCVRKCVCVLARARLFLVASFFVFVFATVFYWAVQAQCITMFVVFFDYCVGLLRTSA